VNAPVTVLLTPTAILSAPMLLCTLLWCVEKAPAQEAKPLGAQQIARLIEQLGDHSFSRREAASAALRLAGAEALPPLRIAAVKNTDLEIRARAARIVEPLLREYCKSASTGMQLTLIPTGEFDMGSPDKESGRREDEKQHKVRITRQFLMGVFEVTQEEYAKVTGHWPSWFSPTGGGAAKLPRGAISKLTRRFPVDSVSWFDAVSFCNLLSTKDGLPPYYRLQEVKKKGTSIVAAKVSKVGGVGYRLPTAAEWEYACRAGAKEDLVGNFQYRKSVNYGLTRDVSLGHTTAAGSYPANPWGLSDMHGNVAEWCWDWYASDYYTSEPATDPQGPAAGKHRVLRGGSWLVKKSSCRCATRFSQAPSEGAYITGFRIARYLP